MFGLILTSVFVLLLAYVTLRASSVPAIRNRLGRAGCWWLAAGLVALFVVGRFGLRDVGGAAAGLVQTTGMVMLAGVFITALPLLVVDVATLFGFALRRWVPRARAWALIAGLGLSLVALVQGMRPPVITSYEVVVPGLPASLDGTVVVALSDTHLGTQRDASWLEERLQQVAELNPDLLVMLGDNIEGHGEIPTELPALARMQPPLGTWFVYGNHDSPWGGEDVTQALTKAGAKVLLNSHAEVAPGLYLAGVADLTSNRRNRFAGDPVTKTLASIPASAATILLSHTPWEYDKAAGLGADLMLSGHTHGGQIWPFGYVVERTYPLLAGQYQVGAMTAIVSRGTGLWGPPMRLWHPAEILKITLRSPN